MDAKIATRTTTSHTAFGHRTSVSSSSMVCKFWKAGKCNRNPCRFLHSNLSAPPPTNNVYLRTPKPSNVLLEEQPKKRRTFSYGPKNSLALTNQCPQKISNLGNYSDVPIICPKRKNCSASNTEADALEDERTKMPTKAQKISNPVTEDAPRKLPDVKTSLDSPTAGNAPDCKKASLVLISEGEAPEDRDVSVVFVIQGDASAEKHASLVSISESEARKDTFSDLVAEGDAPEDKETSLFSTTLDHKAVEGSTRTICVDWMFGTCGKGDECQFLHKWCYGDWFSMLAKLGGHEQAVSGITLPPRCDKLFTGSSDGNVHVWDCHTGETTRVISLGDEIGSLISEGPWTFVGLPNAIKAWNLETGIDLSLNGHHTFGQVNAMAVAGETLFAGAQDGSILAWRGCSENTVPFQLAASMNGHTAAVVCLIVGNGEKMLYSGSIDATIKAWDVETLQCVHTLVEHTDAVTSLICWDYYLLSCSLDRTIKVWASTAESNLEVSYTHNLEHSGVTLCGMSDAEDKPILCCSCNDNSVYLYDLPSFSVRGRIFSKEEVRTIHAGPEGLFFTGDGAGLVTVWKLATSCGSVPVV